MVQFNPVSGPHTHGGESTTYLMHLVLIALLPCTLYGFYLFGLPAIRLVLICAVTAIVCEFACLKALAKNWRSCLDGSSLLTGWLLALSLPPAAPWWIGVLGTLFAIGVGKQVFGGLGQNPFNPAMLARVMLLICFPVELTDWRAIMPIEIQDGSLQVNNAWLGIDAISSATPLAEGSDDLPSLMSLALGQHAGSLGETSAVLVLLGGLFLLWRQVIRWVIPVSLLAGVAIPAAISHAISPEIYLSAMTHLFSGGAMLAAFFIATDMVTSPTSAKGQFIFGLCCGLLIWLIRTFGSYPEGVAFAVLIMNATTPLIDHYLRPAIFGSQKKIQA